MRKLLIIIPLLLLPIQGTIAQNSMKSYSIESIANTLKKMQIKIIGIGDSQLLVSTKDNKKGLIDLFGEIITPLEYSEITLSPDDEGLRLAIKDNKLGYLNTEGQIAIPCKFENATGSSFSEGLAHIQTNGEHYYINKLGQIVISVGQAYSCGTFKNGIAPIQKREGETYFIDMKGNVVILPQPYYCYFYTNDIIMIESSGNNRLGLMDYNGKTILPMQYDFKTSRRTDDLIIARYWQQTASGTASKWGYINKQGELIIEYQFDNAFPFYEGIALVEKNGKYGCINKQGKTIIPFLYDDLWGFNFYNNDAAWVKRNGKYGCINKQGQTLVPFEFDEIVYNSPSYNGFVSAVKDGKAGFINSKGQIILPFQYPEDTYFSYAGNDLIIVHKDMQEALIDTKGNYIVPFGKYDHFIGFVDGIFYVEIYDEYGDIDEYGIIDKDGNSTFMYKDTQYPTSIKNDSLESNRQPNNSIDDNHLAESNENTIIKDNPIEKEQLYETEDTETQPSFPGGDAALSEWVVSNLQYPSISQEEGIQGRVIVGFVIEPDGSITNIEVVKSVDTYLDRAATQLVSKMPKWNPGTVSGKPVRTSYRIPIAFRLK